ncbi:MAG TPA: HEPN domain-containing protein [Oligoflexia bacterium]|nr:HEPN domain-containing protein [Oligoflexia bacterium]HMP49439.1 HEPN domain-containing protein [Oligoflexia bacterium]
MRNKDLALDYIKRAKIRLLAIETLYQEKGYADVVRESQEVVELLLKALLRINDIAIPRIHDVSTLLEEQKNVLKKINNEEIEFLSTTSRSLRRDRELAFYGSEDLTPSEFYRKSDADTAKDQANKVLGIVEKSL